MAANAFAVSWLSFSHAEKADGLCEMNSKDYVNKLYALGFTTVKADNCSQRFIVEASAVLEFFNSNRYRMGARDLIVGRVTVESFGYSDRYTTRGSLLLYGISLEGGGSRGLTRSLPC